jgi:cyclophilin family peptidyl-prolyl cis-trans isomerase
MNFRICLMVVAAAFALLRTHAGTLATFRTSVGNMELELYDEDKPVTVSNFNKYVTSGRFTNQFIQRWVPNFVIQGGGYRVTNTTNGLKITSIPTYPPITNEYSVGRTFSNTYGTIAMARSSQTNSATSQWFISLKNNDFLDQVNGGFTVFGRVTGGTNILNLFIPPPPTNNINLLDLGITPIGEGTPVIGDPQTGAELFASLIYVDVRLRRDVGLSISPTRPGQRLITWNTVAGITNTLEYSSTPVPGPWTTYTNVIGTGQPYSLIDTSADADRAYRVTLTY